jgi:hypothetical protein
VLCETWIQKDKLLILFAYRWLANYSTGSARFCTFLGIWLMSRGLRSRVRQEPVVDTTAESRQSRVILSNPIRKV